LTVLLGAIARITVAVLAPSMVNWSRQGQVGHRRNRLLARFTLASGEVFTESWRNFHFGRIHDHSGSCETPDPTGEFSPGVFHFGEGTQDAVIGGRAVNCMESLGPKHATQLSRGIVEASCRLSGQQAHRAYADAEDQRQHDCILNRSWSILVFCQTAKEIHHGCTSKEERPQFFRGVFLNSTQAYPTPELDADRAGTPHCPDRKASHFGCGLCQM